MQAWTPTGNRDDPLELREVPAPRVGPDELEIAVAAYSINRGETFLLERPEPGWRPGKDVSGRVVAVGSAVTGWAVGDRAVAHPTQGGWAERLVVAADRAAPLPAGLSDRDAAALPLAGLTALRLLRVVGSLAGRRILLTGASGGVGHYVVELAAAQGAQVTAVSSTAERGSRLLELGADRVVTQVADVDSGPHERFDVVLESVGGETTAACWTRLDPHGTLVWFGQASRAPIRLDFFDWSGGASATLRKFAYTDSVVPDGADLATLVRLVRDGHLHPEIGTVRPWTQTPAAVRDLLGRRVRGNVVCAVDAADGRVAA